MTCRCDHCRSAWGRPAGEQAKADREAALPYVLLPATRRTFLNWIVNTYRATEPDVMGPAPGDWPVYDPLGPVAP
jgi:hypothetical protein